MLEKLFKFETPVCFLSIHPFLRAVSPINVDINSHTHSHSTCSTFHLSMCVYEKKWHQRENHSYQYKSHRFKNQTYERRQVAREHKTLPQKASSTRFSNRCNRIIRTIITKEMHKICMFFWLCTHSINVE